MNDSDERTIWCGNLSEKVTEDILYELFLQAGPLERVRIPRDRDGRSRMFGFVTFRHLCSVEYALRLFQGTCLYKKEISMKNRVPLNSPPDYGKQSRLSRTSNSYEQIETDYIRGVIKERPIQYNATLRSPSYHTNGHVDRSLLPRNRRDLGKPHSDDNLIKLTPPSLREGCYNGSYETYMALGRQMMFGTQALQSLMLPPPPPPPLLQETPLSSRRYDNNRHTPYHMKPEHRSHHSRSRSEQRNNRSHSNSDRYNRRSHH